MHLPMSMERYFETADVEIIIDATNRLLRELFGYRFGTSFDA